MRTTISIDDDVLAAAKDLAQMHRRTVGDILSDLARQALRKPAGATERNGIPLLPTRSPGIVITPELVNQLNEETE